MTEYLNKSFSVTMPPGQKYRDNWDAVFAKKEPTHADCKTCLLTNICLAHPCPRCGKS